jgi:DNA-binding NtrC family response regulator
MLQFHLSTGMEASAMSVTAHPRVVIESANRDAALALLAALDAAGFDVTVCGGPAALPGHVCPLVDGVPCPWVDHADVVVHDLDLDKAEHRAVLRTLRRTHPDIPVGLELPTATARQHAALLHGCRVIYPFDMDRLVQAVTDAAAARQELAGTP